MWVSQKNFGIIRKICREFIGFKVFSPISLETYQLPIRRGGLGFLEPSQQQSALQYRCLTPLLLCQDSSDFVTLWLKAHILSLSPLSISDARLPFFFPSLRQGVLANTTPDVIPVLFWAFDSIFDLDSILRSLNVTLTDPPKAVVDICLSLPLTEIIYWLNDNSPLSQRSYRSLTVNDAFTFSSDNSHLVPKSWVNGRQSLSCGRYRIGKLARLLLTGQIMLHPFFARLCLPNGLFSAHLAQLSAIVSELEQPLLDGKSSTILPDTVRCQHLQVFSQRRRLLNPTSGPPGTFRARFWNLSIPVQIRIPWYRLLQNKFPYFNNLYQLIPSVLSSCCQFCQQSNLEDELHFIVFCPKKFEVWVRIWKHFFGFLSVTTDDITAALYHLRFPAKKLSAFRNKSIFGCTFWCIWHAHWLVIFNDQQFVPEAVFQATLVCLGIFYI